MPYIVVFVAGLFVGGAGGFSAGGGAEAISRAVKFAALGGGVYLAGRALKAW